MRLPSPATKWCHITWSTAGRRKFLNIAALARFCERSLCEALAEAGWSGEAAVLPNRVQVLVQVPAAMERSEVIARVRTVATAVVRKAGATPGTRRVWEEACWCSTLSYGIAVEAVRRHLRAIGHQLSVTAR